MKKRRANVDLPRGREPAVRKSDTDQAIICPVCGAVVPSHSAAARLGLSNWQMGLGGDGFSGQVEPKRKRENLRKSPRSFVRPN
jgi:hypothetical protein